MQCIYGNDILSLINPLVIPKYLKKMSQQIIWWFQYPCKLKDILISAAFFIGNIIWINIFWLIHMFEISSYDDNANLCNVFMETLNRLSLTFLSTLIIIAWLPHDLMFIKSSNQKILYFVVFYLFPLDVDPYKQHVSNFAFDILSKNRD